MITKKYLDDVDNVDISKMPQLNDISKYNRNKGISWEIIDLPKPCVNGKGSQTYFMISKGTANKLLIYLEGGGGGTDWISTKAKTITLRPRSKISSLISQVGVFNSKKKENPFKDWTIIFVPYGTGDVHTGNRVAKYHKNKVYHTGFVNFNTIIRWIASKKCYDEVVLSGSSAGGYGVGLNFLKANELIDCPLTLISDAGPDITSSHNPTFSLERTNRAWGYLDNLPEEARDYVEKVGNPIYLLNWAFSKEKYSDVKYGIMADLKDMVLSTSFMKIGPTNYKNKLLEVFSNLKEVHPDRIFRFFKDNHLHTFMPYSRFFTSTIDGTTCSEWTDSLINGAPVDLIED